MLPAKVICRSILQVYATLDLIMQSPLNGKYTPSREDSPPPSYDDVSFMPTRVKACDVCNYQIDIVKHPNDYVVKCPRCSEVTALGNPPKGKRYIRCGCNKLLMCVKSATSITCSRPGCGAVIKPEDNAGAKAKTQQPARRGREELAEPRTERSYRFICGHCQSVSVVDTAPSSHFRCRHCGKRSSVNRSNMKAIFLILVGAVLVAGVMIFMVSTMMLKHNSGYWWAYLLGLALAEVFIFYGLWLLLMKKSTVEVR
ncbi:type 1 phosphatidylinositol 4,5-bisphosphate 4-phosphatase [Rhipicephalus microplus]|uniref:type 1 phosphatidylinositol 4,5-bisphosphate 4-phosphatase n=1 Tax=Rhipicephalus microplus TaxID=6941 RepID=UPI003F6AAADF